MTDPIKLAADRLAQLERWNATLAALGDALTRLAVVVEQAFKEYAEQDEKAGRK